MLASSPRAAADDAALQRYTGEYFRVAQGPQASGPVVHVIITPDFKISYSLEECDKPILRAGAQWFQLMLQNRENPGRLVGQVGDYYSYVKGTLRVVAEPVASYKVLHFQLHHETGEIQQDLYPDTPSGNGLFGTALNTGAPPQHRGESGPPMGRACPKRCRKKNAGDLVDFAQSPTGDAALPECPGPAASGDSDGPGKSDTPASGRAVSKRDVYGEPRAVSKRDVPTPPPSAHWNPGPAYAVPRPPPQAASLPPPGPPPPPPPPPQVQVLPKDSAESPAPTAGPAIAPPVLAPLGTTDNLAPDIKK